MKTPEKDQRYAASEKGKAAARRAYQRYAASPKGREARARAAAKRAAEMTPERREEERQKAAARREERRFMETFPGGQNSPEFRQYRLDHGLPWPVPENEYRDQEIRNRAEMRAHGIPVAYTLDDIAG